MKRSLLATVLLTLLGLLVLAGCAQDREEDRLALCRAALETIQSKDHYHIETENRFEGETVLNSTSFQNHYRSGENWLRCSYIPAEDSTVAELCWNGELYSGYQHAQQATQWHEVPALEEYPPWICTFRWEAQKVTYLGTVEGSSEDLIHVQVEAPFPMGAYGKASDSYTAVFSFGKDQSFRQVQLLYTYTHETLDGSEEAVSVSSTFTLGNLEKSGIEAHLQDIYESVA